MNTDIYYTYVAHFLQKSPVISGPFAKNDLQLKASYWYIYYTYIAHIYTCPTLTMTVCTSVTNSSGVWEEEGREGGREGEIDGVRMRGTERRREGGRKIYCACAS